MFYSIVVPKETGENPGARILANLPVGKPFAQGANRVPAARIRFGLGGAGHACGLYIDRT